MIDVITTHAKIAYPIYCTTFIPFSIEAVAPSSLLFVAVMALLILSSDCDNCANKSVFACLISECIDCNKLFCCFTSSYSEFMESEILPNTMSCWCWVVVSSSLKEDIKPKILETSLDISSIVEDILLALFIVLSNLSTWTVKALVFFFVISEKLSDNFVRLLPQFGISCL